MNNVLNIIDQNKQICNIVLFHQIFHSLFFYKTVFLEIQSLVQKNIHTPKTRSTRTTEARLYKITLKLLSDTGGFSLLQASEMTFLSNSKWQNNVQIDPQTTKKVGFCE